MPFLAPLPGDPDRWVPATTVDLRQLPVSNRWKVYFEVLTPFGHSSRPADEQSTGGPVWRRGSVQQTVPVGLVTDLASVPMPLWGVIATYGRQTLPAILHDATSRSLRSPERPAGSRRAGLRAADELFRLTLRESGTGPVRRWLMWSAVRIFGSPPVAIAFLITVVGGLLALVLGVLVRDSAWFTGALAVVGTAAVVLLALAAAAGFEHRGQPEAAEHVRWEPAAVGSLLGALGIGVVALPLLTPLIVLTFVTELVVGLGEGKGESAPVEAQDLAAPRPPITRITFTTG